MDNKEFYASRLDAEHAITLKVLGAVLDDGLDYTPHEKSRTAGQLIGHMLGHYKDLVELLDDGVIHHKMENPFENVADACAQFDEDCQALRGRVAEADDAKWGRTAEFWVGDYKAGEGPSAQFLWGWLFDLIHHRGQLSTYLRPMGSKVPGMYGPSADDEEG